METQIKYTPLRKMLLKEEPVDQKIWVAEAVKLSKLPEDVVKHLVEVSLDENTAMPENLTKAQVVVAEKVIISARRDFLKVHKMSEEKKAKEEAEKAAAKAAKEAEEKALAEKKSSLSLMFQEAEAQSTEIVQAGRFEDLRDELVAGALGEHFVLVDGNIILKDGEDAVKSFAAGFANLNNLVNKADDMKGGLALYEARLARAAMQHPDIGDLWPNYFNGAKDTDISRIKKGIAALETADKLGVDIGTIPLSTARVIFEARYDKDDEKKNDELKKQAFEKFIEKSEEAGAILPQTAAKALVSQLRPETNRGEARVNWKFVYVLADGSGVVGTTKFDKVIFERSSLVFSHALDIVTIDKKGDIKFSQVPAPTAADAPKKESDEKAAKPAAKKAAKKKAAPAPEPEPTPEPSVEETAATPDGQPEESLDSDPNAEDTTEDFGLGGL